MALGYNVVSIVGGKDIEEQAYALRHGTEIVIATPGRLKDCLERTVLVLSQCTYVVMDEADRMVSLGFEEVINFILNQLPVSNLKPDTDDAENVKKMITPLLNDVGEEMLYRQTVSLFTSALFDTVLSLNSSCFRPLCHRQ